MKRRGWMFTVLALIAALGGAVMVTAQDGGDRAPISPTNAAQLAELAVLDTQSQEAYDSAWSADGRWFAVANSNGVWLYDAANLTAAARELDADATLVTSVAFSRLTSDSGDKSVKVWNAATSQQAALSMKKGPPSTAWREGPTAKLKVTREFRNTSFTTASPTSSLFRLPGRGCLFRRCRR